MARARWSGRLGSDWVKTNHFDTEPFFDGVLLGEKRIDSIQCFGVVISFPALSAYFRLHIFYNIELTL